MRPRTSLLLLTAGLAALSLTGCGQELPTSVGGELLPEAGLRTYELVLDPSQYLAADSVVGGFGTNLRASALVVAHQYLGVFDSRPLLRFSPYPKTVTYGVDSATVRTDSTPTYIGGQVVVRVDTTSLGLDTLGTDTAIAFRLYSVGEAWDARTATWTVRDASTGDTLLWSTPGGTTSALLDSAVWVRGDSITGDSLVFDIDSATIAQWGDQTDPSRGALLTTTDAGVKALVRVLRLRLYARPSANPDTVVVAATGVIEQTFLSQPEPPPPSDYRVGGRASWRTFLTFQDSLWTREFPCPDGAAGCTIRLADATVNRAELLLQPVVVPELFRPVETFALEARAVLGPADVPLERAPLSPDTAGVAYAIEPATFATPDADRLVIGVTRVVANLAAAPDSAGAPEPPHTVALVSAPEPLAFGFGAFAPADSAAAAPLLRLIVTVQQEEQ